MMRRCVALWRSDSCWGDATIPRNAQAMSHGLSLWLPCTGWARPQRRTLRSVAAWEAAPASPSIFETPRPWRRSANTWLVISRARPLVHETITRSRRGAWTRHVCWPFISTAVRDGVVQIFRGPGATDRNDARLRLRGLDPAARYGVTSWEASRKPAR